MSYRRHRRAPGPPPLLALLVSLTLLASACGSDDPQPLALDEALAADWSQLDTEIITRMPATQRGGTAVLLLHGYGGSGPGLSEIARALMADDRRVFLPTAALPHPSGGAMWWEFIEGDWPKPWSDDPGSNHWPPSRQLPRARAAVVALVDGIRARYAPEHLVVAGYSQGAMLALDAGLTLEPPPDGIVAVAGYTLLDSLPAIEKPRSSPPTVFIAHGASDELVPFVRAEWMKGLLERAGFLVIFEPHPGGHAFAPETVRKISQFLRRW